MPTIMTDDEFILELIKYDWEWVESRQLLERTDENGELHTIDVESYNTSEKLIISLFTSSNLFAPLTPEEVRKIIWGNPEADKPGLMKISNTIKIDSLNTPDFNVDEKFEKKKILAYNNGKETAGQGNAKIVPQEIKEQGLEKVWNNGYDDYLIANDLVEVWY